MDTKKIIAVADSYNKKYYFNEENYAILPSRIKEEIRQMCVLFVDRMGGNISLEIDDDEELIFKTYAKNNDIYYDEIGAALKIKQLRVDYRELLESLQMFIKIRNDQSLGKYFN